MGILSVLKGLSVLLPVIISTMATVMASGVTYNMLVQKLCSPTGPPDDINRFICPDSSIMSYITGILSTKAAIQTVMSALGGCAFGFIRDLTGKSKILMYVGATGDLISAVGSLMSAYYWNSSPWILAIIQAIAAGGFGESIIVMGASCILLSESSPEELPLRMQIFMVSALSVVLIGGLVTTLVVTTLGYLWLFTLCIVLHLVALLLIFFLVKNKGYQRKSLKDSLIVLKKVFKWRENVTVLWLMLITMAVEPIIYTCEGIHSGTFFQLKFRFTMYKGLVYSLYSFSIAIVGSIAGPTILRKVFHMKDLSIGIIVCLTNSFAAFMFPFANTELFLYLCALAYFMKLASLPLPSTVINTIVKKDELGTYLGMKSILTACLPFGMNRLYQEVASRNIKTWVGAFYFVSSGCFFFLALLFSVSYCLYVEPKKQEDPDSTENLRQDRKRSEAEDIPEIR